MSTRNRVRLGDNEREQLFELLKRHAAAGRLDVSELERRIEIVAGAESRQDAAAALSDLPPLAAAAARPRRRFGRGHGEADAAAADWQATGERFRDPRSGKIMRVWIDGGGGRHYVAEPTE